MSDPFNLVKGEVQSSLRQAKILCESVPNITSQAELRRVQTELSDLLENISGDIDDLSQTVFAVERDPSSFNVTIEELESRKQFIATARQDLTGLQSESDRSESTFRIAQSSRQREELLAASDRGAQRRGVATTTSGSQSSSDRHSVGVDVDSFIQDHNMQQQLLVKEQDLSMDDLGRTVGRLHRMGRDINTELEQQSRILDDFEHEMDTTTSRMSRLQAGVQHLLETKGLRNSQPTSACVPEVATVFAHEFDNCRITNPFRPGAPVPSAILSHRTCHFDDTGVLCGLRERGK